MKGVFIIMKKKELLCILAIIALSAVFTGCANNDNANQQVQNSEEKAIVQETVETSEVVSENEVLPGVVVFDGIIAREGEEITIKPGDQLMVEGDDDFVIGLVECSHIAERDVYRAELTYVDGDYVGENLIYFSTSDEDRESWGIEEDYSLISNISPAREITIKSMAKDELVLVIGERMATPAPLVLSGNKGEIAHIDDYSYIETDLCYIYFDKDINVESNIGTVINDIMKQLEDNTGLKYYEEGNVTNTTGGFSELYFGTNPWEAVNIYNDKVNVYFFADKDNEGLISVACPNAALFIVDDIFDEEGNIVSINTLAHELMHVLTYKYVDNCGKISMEGIATYQAVQVANQMKDEYAIGYMDCRGGQGTIADNLNGNTAEALYLNDYQDDHTRVKEYQYGSYLMTYLADTYGDGFYKDYITELRNTARNIMDITIDEEAAALKGAFGDDVFVKFGEYYVTNKSQFEFPEAGWMDK